MYVLSAYIAMHAFVTFAFTVIQQTIHEIKMTGAHIIQLYMILASLSPRPSPRPYVRMMNDGFKLKLLC